MALRRFPLITPVDGEGKVFRGFLPVHSNEYLVEVHLAQEGQAPCIYGSPELRHKLQGINNLDRLSQYDDITLLLSELKGILEENESVEAKSHISVKRYKIIMDELKEIGFHLISDMSKDMNEITFQLTDNGHVHTIQAHIPSNYPVLPPTIVSDGPKQEHEPKFASLRSAVKHHTQLFEMYRDYFACMDELDTHTRVLDPDQPSGKDPCRRIALTNHCSLHFEVYPKQPRAGFRTKRFFGSEKHIEALHRLWDAHRWNKTESPYQNLRRILGDRLMAKIDKHDPMDTSADVECAICYSYKLQHPTMGMLTPDVICTNDQCNRGFHPTCIYEWLRSNPATTRSFNVLFGKCPYCNEVTCNTSVMVTYAHTKWDIQKITTEAVL
ncbi:WD-repeat region-domain-containing protein [Fennellomyces sp. T-0311]|nr:WD-repeat region-domain-containing protein [Fennellomyces sp. T-0311]